MGGGLKGERQVNPNTFLRMFAASSHQRCNLCLDDDDSSFEPPRWGHVVFSLLLVMPRRPFYRGQKEPKKGLLLPLPAAVQFFEITVEKVRRA